MKKLGFIILLAAITLSCNSDDNNGTESVEKIIFGEIYGMCAGDCRTLYLLKENGIYEDADTDTDFGEIIEPSDWENTTFKTQPLSGEQFQFAKQLLQFPYDLLESNDKIVQQKWADFDYFIQIKTNKRSKTLIFDEINETTDSEIKQYLQSMIEINNELKEL